MACRPLLLFALGASHLGAQSSDASRETPADSACSYRRCALGIVPTWNGLAVVRGDGGPRVANLHFFWPRDVTPVLRGPDGASPGAEAAAAQARRAVALRRIGAALTDGGLLAVVVAATRSLHRGRAGRSDQLVGGAGAGALLLSVPFQFAADGALSRAVWWHNLRFER